MMPTPNWNSPILPGQSAAHSWVIWEPREAWKLVVNAGRLAQQENAAPDADAAFFGEPDQHVSKLGDQDSNLNKQNQNLLCYRYTIPQDGRARSETVTHRRRAGQTRRLLFARRPGFSCGMPVSSAQ